MTDPRSDGPLPARPDDCCGGGVSTYSDGYAVAFTVRPPSEHTPVEGFTHLMWSLIQRVWPRDLPPPDNPFEGVSLPEHDIFMEGGFARDEPDLRFWVLRWMDGVVDQSRLVFHCELRLSVDVSNSRSGIDLFFSTWLAGSAESLLVDPVNCTVGHHRVVRHVIERFDSRIGERPLSEKIRSVTGHRAERFMREDLFDRQRRLPILAVSEREDGSGPVVAASELDALELAAMAEIVMLDPGASRAIGGRVGPDLACADGALRIWWPGVDADVHLQAQTLWTPDDLGDDSARRLLPIRDSLSRTATRRALREDSFWRYSEIEYFSQREYVAAGDGHIMFPVEIVDNGFESGPAHRLPGNLSRLLSAGIEPASPASLEAPPPDPDIGRLRDELASVREDLKKTDRAKRRLARDVDVTRSQRDQLNAEHTAALARARAAGRDELNVARAATSALDEEIAGLREALARERADADLVRIADEQIAETRELRAEIGRLRYENSSLAERLNGHGADCMEAPDDGPPPASVIEALETAERLMPRIRLSAEARRSASGSGFERPADVYRALRILNGIAEELVSSDGSLGGALRDRFREAGIDYSAFESPTTWSRWADERRASYSGHTYEMMKHLRWGGVSRDGRHHLRLYFEWEPDGEFVVIGHTGPHLTNTKT